MKARVLKFKKRDLNLFNDTYRGVSVLDQINFALSDFYSTPCSDKKEMPKEWNPIFIHYSCSIFDPYRIGTADYALKIKDLYEPFQGASGVERTKIFLEQTKQLLSENAYHTEDFGLNHIEPTMSCHFITTREPIDENKDIIGFYHIESKKYKRYLINDVRKLCELLRFSSYDFPRIFGHSDEFQYYGRKLPKEEFQSRVSEFVEDASHIDIKDENILAMLSFFRDSDSNVLSLSS